MVHVLSVSIRNLKRNKIRSFLATIGIILGTLAITALLSLGFGLQASIQSQFESAGGELLQISAERLGAGPPGANAVATITQDDLEVVQQSDGVRVATGRLIEQTSVRVDDEDRSATITSFPRATEERQLIETQLDLTISEGRFLQAGEENSVVIGSSYAEGDNPLRVRDSVTIQNESLDVVGVLSETGQFVVDQTVIMEEDRVRDLFDEPTAYNLLIAQPTGSVEEAQNTIRRELRRERNVEEGEEDFQVQTNQEALQSITSILQIISGVLAAIGAISLVLGGITIMNTMYTTVLERTREIGVMKSVGATKRDITKLFVMEAGLIGFIGGLTGSIAGFGIAELIAFFARSSLNILFFQALLSPWLFAVGVGFATLTGLFSGYAPARRAAKKDSVEALRG
jgi:putative ABC transport system permease protein